MATSLSDLELAPRTTDVDDVPVDKLLVLQFQNGGREAYAEIFERYRPLTERICYRILGNREDAQEAVQETMLRVSAASRRSTAVTSSRHGSRASPRTSRWTWSAPARAGRTPESGCTTSTNMRTLRSTPRSSSRGSSTKSVSAPSSMSSPITTERRWSCGSSRVARTRRSATPWACHSAQAKALIHRAKGTFRRAWSEDRRGVAALAPWFLIPNLFRRAADAAQTVGGRVAATPSCGGGDRDDRRQGHRCRGRHRGGRDRRCGRGRRPAFATPGDQAVAGRGRRRTLRCAGDDRRPDRATQDSARASPQAEAQQG